MLIKKRIHLYPRRYNTPVPHKLFATIIIVVLFFVSSSCVCLSVANVAVVHFRPHSFLIYIKNKDSKY